MAPMATRSKSASSHERPERNISIDTDPFNGTKRRAVLIVESLWDPVKVDVETVMYSPMYKSGSLRNSIATAPMELKLPRNLKLENKFDNILLSLKAELCRLSSSRLDKPKFLRLCDSIALKCCRERAHGGCLPILDTPEAAYTCIVKESDVYDPVVVHQVIDEMENASLKSQLKDYEGDLKSFSCTTLTSISHLKTSLQPCDDNHAHMAVLCSEEEVLLSGINKMKYYFKEHLELDDIFFEGYHIGCTVVYFTISKKGMPYLLSNILSQAEKLQKQFSLTHLIVFNNFVCDLGQKTISDDTQRFAPPECQTVAQDLALKDDTESTNEMTAPGPSGPARSPSTGDQTPPPKRSELSIGDIELVDSMPGDIIVLGLGSPGVGKSTFGNFVTILDNSFEEGHTLNPQTKEVSLASHRIDGIGRCFRYIDSPGLNHDATDNLDSLPEAIGVILTQIAAQMEQQVFNFAGRPSAEDLRSISRATGGNWKDLLSSVTWNTLIEALKKAELTKLANELPPKRTLLALEDSVVDQLLRFSQKCKSSMDKMTAPGPLGPTRSPSTGDQTPPPKRAKSSILVADKMSGTSRSPSTVDQNLKSNIDSTALLRYKDHLVSQLHSLGMVLGLKEAAAILATQASLTSKYIQITDTWMRCTANPTLEKFCSCLSKCKDFTHVRTLIEQEQLGRHEEGDKPSSIELLDAVIPKVAADWEVLSIRLELEDKGRIIAKDYAKVEDRCRHMLRAWTNGEGRKPVTWETLLEVMGKCDYKDLADELAERLKLGETLDK